MKTFGLSLERTALIQMLLPTSTMSTLVLDHFETVGSFHFVQTQVRSPSPKVYFYREKVRMKNRNFGLPSPQLVYTMAAAFDSSHRGLLGTDKQKH